MPFSLLVHEFELGKDDKFFKNIIQIYKRLKENLCLKNTCFSSMQLLDDKS